MAAAKRYTAEQIVAKHPQAPVTVTIGVASAFEVTSGDDDLGYFDF